MNIAIFNTEARKAVPIIRNLGKAGYTLYSFSFERISFAGSSRWVKKNIYIKGWNTERILESLEQYRIEVVLPIEDPTIEHFARERERFSNYTLVIPEFEDFILFSDKGRTTDLAAKNGLTAPETFTPASVDEALEYLDSAAAYPLVIKPRRGTSAIGVKIVGNRDEAVRQYRTLSERFQLPLIQEFIPPGGRTVGAEFLFYRGREILSFAHERIREYPVRRGPSTFCKNCPDEAPIALGRKLFEGMNYSGFAMVEFKEHPGSGELYLIEVNPRPWGSITLPISAGVNFPVEAVRIFSDPEGYAGPDRDLTYAPGEDFYMRWFFPGDILKILN